MAMNLTFFVFLIFVSFSTEKARKWTLRSLPHESSETDHHQAVDLQKQEQRVEIAKEKLITLEERLQEHLEESKKKLSLLEERLQENRAQNLQKMEERFHKREQIINVAEQKRQKKQKVIQLQKQKIQKYQQFGHKQSIYPNSSNLHNRLKDRKGSELSEKECVDPTKMKMTVPPNVSRFHVRKLSSNELSNFVELDLVELYPNKSSIKVFCDTETNVISWEDPENLVRDESKKSIESSLQQKEKAMSNGLFDCIFKWYTYRIPNEANPFVRELLFSMSDYVDVDRRDKSNRTPLMLAAGYDAEKVVVNLVGRGAKMEVVDHDGRTALHYAAGNGNYSSCKVLLQKGANVNAQNKNQRTPLMWAALFGQQKCSKPYAEVFKLLLNSGADTELRSTSGETAFQLASPNWANFITAHKANLKISKSKFDN